MSDKLLTEHHLEFLSLKGGCTGSSESTLVKMPHCWKSRVAAQLQCNLTSSFITINTVVSVTLSLTSGFHAQTLMAILKVKKTFKTIFTVVRA